jgi:acyl dehydratase
MAAAPVTYEKLMSLRSENVPYRYEERDTLLYAVSIGMGRDPLNRSELNFVFEGNPLRVVPTQAVVVARQRLIWDVGLNVNKFLHGEQKLALHRPMPIAADLLADAWVSEVYDKGAGKGSIIELEGVVRDAADDQPLFSWSSLIFARGDGGIGGSTRKAPAPHAIPDRAPDIVKRAETRRDQPLLYRLNGDRNLVHVDPDFAARAGFPTPILHGACTYAIACREVLAEVVNYDHTRLKTCDVRFTAPVFPGETIETEIWVEAGHVAYRARVVERDLRVLDHGRCELQESRL